MSGHTVTYLLPTVPWEFKGQGYTVHTVDSSWKSKLKREQLWHAKGQWEKPTEYFNLQSLFVSPLQMNMQ